MTAATMDSILRLPAVRGLASVRSRSMAYKNGDQSIAN